MRYQGPSRSPWPIIAVVVIAVIVVVALYFLFLQPR
jgi:disulfide bond formation protein DsbB